MKTLTIACCNMFGPLQVIIFVAGMAQTWNVQICARDTLIISILCRNDLSKANQVENFISSDGYFRNLIYTCIAHLCIVGLYDTSI